MDIAEVLLDLYGRIDEHVAQAVTGLSADELCHAPTADTNSIGWLVWHLTRVQDHHLSELLDEEQEWITGPWAPRFGLEPNPANTGYGHTAAQVFLVRPDGADALVGYHRAVAGRTHDFLASLTAEDLDRVVDRRSDPPVTLGVRLISVADDDLQHAGQAAYVRGLLGRSEPVAGTRTLAEVYRHFGEVDAAETSPLYERVAVALSESDEALRAIEAAPARKRHPAVILAALHDLALAGRAPALAAAYAAADSDAATGAAIHTLVRMTDSVVAIAVRRPTRADEAGRSAVLYPAIAEAAHRVGADAVGLIDVGCSAGLNLNVDRVGITYSNGQSLGDPTSPVQLSCSIVGDRPVPTRPMPEVVARVGVDLDPLDVTDADDARWLHACLGPDQPERAERLDAEMALAATAPPLLLAGDVVEVVPDAFARVPADALPVVITTWALSSLSLERRLRFLHRLDDAAVGRTVAWVSAEGVGVAPAIPTLGDRRASGHSIIGLAVFEGSALRAEAIGRCWSRGRLLAWLTDSE